MLAHGSLFSGIEGFGMGFRQHGIQTRWLSEIDPHACRVLAHHFPGIPNHGDITQIDPAQLEPVDIITFGSPCQDLSVAGQRRGFAGERSGLYFEAIRIIDAVRPAIAIWENVVGSLSSNAGRDFGAALDALANIGALDIGWSVLDAQYWGVPQRRRRVFVIADFRGHRAAEILALADGLSGHPAPRREARESVAGTLGGGSGSRDWAPDTDRMTFVPTQSVYPILEAGARTGISTTDPRAGMGIGDADDPMFTLQSTKQHAVAVRTANTGANGHGVADDVAHTLDGANGQAVITQASAIESPDDYCGPDDEAPRYACPKCGHRMCAVPSRCPACDYRFGDGTTVVRATYWDGGDIADTLDASNAAKQQSMPEKRRFQAVITHALTAEGHDASEDGTGRGTPLVAFNWQTGGDMRLGLSTESVTALGTSQTPAVAFTDVAGPLVDSGGQRGWSSSVDSPNFVGHGMAVRRLTPRECERLMGFQDDYTLVDGMSDSARYRMLGNSVVVNVAAWLGKQCVMALEAEQSA
jgi:DNA (cytosine-5)-methyltransferase 1